MRADFIVAPPVFARIGGDAIETLLALISKPQRLQNKLFSLYAELSHDA
jgi:hypothetical protein